MKPRAASGKRKQLFYALLILALITVIALAAVYVNFSSALHAALNQSLNTFRVDRVEYPAVGPDAVDVNMTFVVENPSNLAVTVDAITLSFWIDDIDIGTVAVTSPQEMLPGEASYFQLVRNVKDPTVLERLQNPTYELRMVGQVRGSARHFFVEATVEKTIDAVRTVAGIG